MLINSFHTKSRFYCSIIILENFTCSFSIKILNVRELLLMSHDRAAAYGLIEA